MSNFKREISKKKMIFLKNFTSDNLFITIYKLPLAIILCKISHSQNCKGGGVEFGDDTLQCQTIHRALHLLHNLSKEKPGGRADLNQQPSQVIEKIYKKRNGGGECGDVRPRKLLCQKIQRA